MELPKGKIKYTEIDKFFKDSINYHIKIFYDEISQYEPTCLFENWKKLIRCIDEIINLPLEIKASANKHLFETTNISTKTNTSLAHFKQVFQNVAKEFDSNVAERFKSLTLMSTAINSAFKSNGVFEKQGESLTLTNTKNSIEYFQSRRLYFVTTLFLIPKIAKGTKETTFMDLLNLFLYTMDSCLTGITKAYYYLLINNSLDDFEVYFDGSQGIGNFNFTQLETFFLNPQRLSLLDQMEFRRDIISVNGILGKSNSKIFSFSEVADTMTLMQCAFKKYKIENLNVFLKLNLFFCEIGAKIIDDYEIIIEEEEFILLQSKYQELELFEASNDYFKILNCISPFQKLGNKYYSTVVLLSRYAYNLLSNALMKNRSFQINSGFVFEDIIRDILKKNGFEDMKIKRINRREFDVVTVKNQKIYNFQCKNNYYDIAQVNYDYGLISRLNKRLCKYYEKAIEKERKRENLLIKKIGLSDIEHFVISRFPVITRNERIINYNQIHDWIENHAS